MDTPPGCMTLRQQLGAKNGLYRYLIKTQVHICAICAKSFWRASALQCAREGHLSQACSRGRGACCWQAGDGRPLGGGGDSVDPPGLSMGSSACLLMRRAGEFDGIKSLFRYLRLSPGLSDVPCIHCPRSPQSNPPPHKHSWSSWSPKNGWRSSSPGRHVRRPATRHSGGCPTCDISTTRITL